MKFRKFLTVFLALFVVTASLTSVSALDGVEDCYLQQGLEPYWTIGFRNSLRTFEDEQYGDYPISAELNNASIATDEGYKSDNAGRLNKSDGSASLSHSFSVLLGGGKNSDKANFRVSAKAKVNDPNDKVKLVAYLITIKPEKSNDVQYTQTELKSVYITNTDYEEVILDIDFPISIFNDLKIGFEREDGGSEAFIDDISIDEIVDGKYSLALNQHLRYWQLDHCAYADQDFEPLYTAYANVEKVLGNREENSNDIQELGKVLQEEIDKLVYKKPAPKTDLEAIVKEAEIKNSHISNEYLNLLPDAIEHGKHLLKISNVSDKEITLATNRLKYAIEKFDEDFTPVSKETVLKLEGTIETAAKELQQAHLYSEESLTILRDVIQEAFILLEKETIYEVEVVEMISRVEEAISALEENPNPVLDPSNPEHVERIETVEEELFSIAKIDRGLYTEESLARLDKTIRNLQDIVDYFRDTAPTDKQNLQARVSSVKTRTLEELQDAIIEYEAAKNALIKKEISKPIAPEVKPEIPVDKPLVPETKPSENLPATGISSLGSLIPALSVVLGTTILVNEDRRKRNKK